MSGVRDRIGTRARTGFACYVLLLVVVVVGDQHRDTVVIYRDSGEIFL